MSETQPIGPVERQKRRYWTKVGLIVRKGLRMHQISGQLTKDATTLKRERGNVTEHCLVQVARTETLGKWIGLPEDLIMDMNLGAVLHDFSKRQEITATRETDQNSHSPLVAVRKVQAENEQKLIEAGFDERVRRLANASGGDAPQLIEVQRILDQSTLSDDDWAYLIVHYVDNCSIGDDWVRPAEGNRVNIIDYRTQENKAKTDYQRIGLEIQEELKGSAFEGMNSLNAMAVVSHQIEKRFALKIAEQTEETVNPLQIPELVDQKIRQLIENYP